MGDGKAALVIIGMATFVFVFWMAGPAQTQQWPKPIIRMTEADWGTQAMVVHIFNSSHDAMYHYAAAQRVEMSSDAFKKFRATFNRGMPTYFEPVKETSSAYHYAYEFPNMAVTAALRDGKKYARWITEVDNYLCAVDPVFHLSYDPRPAGCVRRLGFPDSTRVQQLAECVGPSLVAEPPGTFHS